MANIKERSEQIVRDMSFPLTFVHSWLRSGDDLDTQVNQLLDEIDFTNPAFIFFEVDYTENPDDSGVLKLTYPFSAMILFQSEEDDPLELRVEHVLTDLEKAKSAAREFLFELNYADEVKRTGLEIVERNISVIDQAFDAIVYGVGINCNVPYTESITGCPDVV